MKRIIKIVLSLIAVPILLSLTPIQADGGGNLQLGYLYTDEVGNLAVNHDTFNTYDGFNLSLNDFAYRFNNGISLGADLNSITLNNRNLTTTISKPGRFSLTAHHDKYRRTYDFNGQNDTRRRTTSFGGTFQPCPHTQLYAGYAQTARKGTTNDLVSETIDAAEVDYTHNSFFFGSNMLFKKHSLSWEYRHYSFSDNIETTLYNTDRSADAFRVSASTTVPKYDWVLLSGGYNYRKDKLDVGNDELKTNLGWGAAKLYFPGQYILNYRLSYVRTDHISSQLETDNAVNTISIGKSWTGRFGLRIGYENRIADDLTDRTESNGFLFNAWFKIQKQLLVRVFTSARANNVVRGTTLLGEESVARHKVSAIYTPSSRFSLRVQWNGQIASHDPDTQIRDTLTNNDVGSRVDYNTLTATLKVAFPEYGKVVVSHTYYLGQYENNSADLSYEFSDHLFRASLYPNSYKNLLVFGSGTYYRSRRNRDVEKISLSFGAEYLFKETYTIGAQYDVHNFDNFQVYDEYYTGNFVHIYVSRKFEI